MLLDRDLVIKLFLGLCLFAVEEGVHFLLVLLVELKFVGQSQGLFAFFVEQLLFVVGLGFPASLQLHFNLVIFFVDFALFYKNLFDRLVGDLLLVLQVLDLGLGDRDVNRDEVVLRLETYFLVLVLLD